MRIVPVVAPTVSTCSWCKREVPVTSAEDVTVWHEGIPGQLAETLDEWGDTSPVWIVHLEAHDCTRPEPFPTSWVPDLVPCLECGKPALRQTCDISMPGDLSRVTVDAEPICNRH